MALTAHWMILSEIPLLDWNGPQFLMFYLVALGVCVGWSFWRSSQSMARFQVPGNGSPALTNPYEIAYLTGGAFRAVQLVVVRLVSQDLLEWKLIRGSQVLRSKARSFPSEMNGIESTAMKSAERFGNEGMQLKNVADAIIGPLTQIERRLAILGLRPMASEQSGVALRAALPLVFLIALGITKLFIGISREKPVLYLVFLLLLSLILVVVIVVRAPRLTVKGRGMIHALHGHHANLEKRVLAKKEVTPDEALVAMSLLGPASLIGMGGHLGIGPLLSAKPKKVKADTGGNGCATYIGCGGGSGGGSMSDGGGSGCGGDGGGGGCGGCGAGD